MSTEKKYREAAELVCIAHDYLRNLYDMESVPLDKIDKFVKRYIKADSQSGKILLRIDPRLHKKLSRQAKKQGKSLNALINDCLEAKGL